ncbi:MAG: AI-2E family transporter, partial [Calditrichia bacterium]
GGGKLVRKAIQDGYIRKVVIAVSIVLLSLLLIYVFALLSHILMIIFAGILLAVFLSGISRFLHEKTHLPYTATLIILVVILVMLFGLFFWLSGPRIAAQMGILSEQFPRAMQQVEDYLSDHGWGRLILKNTPEPTELMNSKMDVFGKITGIFSTTLSIGANILIILFLGFYLAVNPDLYLTNGLRLLPLHRRDRAKQVLLALTEGLRWWLAGRLASMFVVGFLTAIGLVIIGLPLAFTLGLIAALLSFIPYIGPIMALVPAIVVGLAESPTMVIYVLLVYMAVQFMESYLITPLIQERAVSIPPAVLISMQIVMGVLLGAVGVLMATPSAVVLIITVQMLYVEDVLGDKVKVLGDHSGY